MTAGDVSTAVTDIQDTGDLILAAVEGVDPGAAVPAEKAGSILDTLSQLAQKALAAWSVASGQPITPESVLLLMPNSTPLTPPPAGS